MPPKSKLSSAEIDTLKRWIDEGAVWPDGVDVAKAGGQDGLVGFQAAQGFKFQSSKFIPKGLEL
jgi:hypothetical protein